VSDSRIRWGILATGGIAATFVKDLRLLPDAEVVAVGSRTLDAAQRFAKTHDIERAYGSWAELAADPDVDVIYVATPHSHHHAATVVCLQAGKPALTEKPLTTDRASSLALVELARQRNAFFMEAMWTRCFPAVRRALDLVHDGAIGELVSVHADFGVATPYDPTHRLHARALAGGALLDLGVYPVTMAHLFLGEPSSIRAWGSLNQEGVDRSTAMLFGYDSGAFAALSCSVSGDSARHAVITGTRGRIEFPRHFFMPRRFELYRDRSETPEVTDLPHEGMGYQFEAAEVHRCLRAGLLESPLVPHATTLSVMGILDRVLSDIGVSYP
jgi:predicted dehydrogenase